LLFFLRGSKFRFPSFFFLSPQGISTPRRAASFHCKGGLSPPISPPPSAHFVRVFLLELFFLFSSPEEKNPDLELYYLLGPTGPDQLVGSSFFFFSAVEETPGERLSNPSLLVIFVMVISVCLQPGSALSRERPVFFSLCEEHPTPQQLFPLEYWPIRSFWDLERFPLARNSVHRTRWFFPPWAGQSSFPPLKAVFFEETLFPPFFFSR